MTEVLCIAGMLFGSLWGSGNLGNWSNTEKGLLGGAAVGTGLGSLTGRGNPAAVPFPQHRVAAPDILQIDASRLVPRGPYKLEPSEVLQIAFNGVAKGQFTITPEGTIELGRPFGPVRVAGLTVEQAQRTIRSRLGLLSEFPDVSVSLVQMRGMQNIRGEHLVRPDGTISLGMYGTVHVGGMTLGQVKIAVENHIAPYLVDPQVSVEVHAYHSRKVYIVDDSADSGKQVIVLPANPGMTILDALGHSSALPRLASAKRIWVERPGRTGLQESVVLPVDWRAITQSGRTETNYQLVPGDRVYVSNGTKDVHAQECEKTSAPKSATKALGTQQVQFDVVLVRVDPSALPKFSLDGSETPISSNGRDIRFSAVMNKEALFNLLQKLRNDGRVKILAEPRVTTLSGRPAIIMSGGETPILGLSGPDAPYVSYQQFGTTIHLLPIVQKNGSIYLEMRPEVATPMVSFNANLGCSNTVHGVHTRTAHVAVELKDGQTLAFSGLAHDDTAQAASRIPIVGALPVVGKLFTLQPCQKTPQELVVFVTPRVIVGEKNFEIVSHPMPAPERRSSQTTLDDVMRMSSAGIPEDIILRQIETTHSTFALTADDIVRMYQGGVSKLVIRAMQETAAAKPRPLSPGVTSAGKLTLDLAMPPIVNAPDFPYPLTDIRTNEPTKAVVREMVSYWDNHVRFTDDVVNKGKTLPGLAGRVYLFADENTSLEAKGRVVVELYDMTGGRSFKLAVWTFDADTLKKLKKKDLIGDGYRLFLPWDGYRPEVKDIKLQSFYQPDEGTLVDAEPAQLTLRQDDDRAIIQASATREVTSYVPPAPAARNQMSLKEIVRLTQLGTPDDSIIQLMETTRSVFNLGVSDHIYLQQEGVSAAVINAIQTRKTKR